MSPNELVDDVRKQPFVPFTLVMSDGAIFPIDHPDQCLVLTTAAIVGVRNEPGKPLYDRYVKVDCRHISRLEYRGSTEATGSNGQHS